MTTATCPFVHLVATGRLAEARALATRPPEPAEPLVIDWLVAEAQRQLEAGEIA